MCNYIILSKEKTRRRDRELHIRKHDDDGESFCIASCFLGQRFNGYPRRLSNATRGPAPTFLVTNYFRDGSGKVLRNGRNQIASHRHRNSETSLMASKSTHQTGENSNRSRSFDARELVSRNHGYLFGSGLESGGSDDDRRLSVSSCSKIPGKPFLRNQYFVWLEKKTRIMSQ